MIQFWLPRIALFSSLVLQASIFATGQTSMPTGISLPTAIRVQASGWWPTKGDVSRDEFAGPSSCSLCHFAKASSFKAAAMSQASVSPLQSSVLHEHEHLKFSVGDYSYEMISSAERSTLTVHKGGDSLSTDLQWAFGIGHMGQTFLYTMGDQFYEAHVSFFVEPQKLEVTPGQDLIVPKNLHEALGRLQEPSEIKRCFGCHMTASSTDGNFDPEHAFWGVTCEACHGPGAKHIAAMKSGDPNGKQMIFNPARLDPVSSVDFCGACHRTWQDVVGNGLIGAGMLNVRFAPYRLENSRCWKQQDARITCTACHDPHRPLVKDEGSYDSPCFNCHRQRGQSKSLSLPGRACPVAAQKCVSCHMPKYKPTSLHSSFTDHWIRVVKPGAPYPE